MKLITISREFASGGRELGKRLADLLGFAYYDREILESVAAKNDMSADYVRIVLAGGWRTVPLTFRRSFVGVAVQNRTKTTLLLSERDLLRQIAAEGQNAVIIGRNADVILAEHRPLRLFVTADTEAKIARCTERAEGTPPTRREILAKMKEIDKSRAAYRELVTDTPWGAPATYDLAVNTAGWEMRRLAAAIAAYTEAWFEEKQ